MKVLITGSNGQLGNKLIALKPFEVKLIATTKETLDLSDEQKCFDFILKYKPDWIINCGAYTNVDKAEIENDMAYKINALAPFAFAKALLITGGKLLQISTDYVFDGKATRPYSVDHDKHPINLYGQSKSIGEDLIKDILINKNQAIILRTSWIMGNYGNNFLTKVKKLINERDELKVVSDQIGCPTFTKSLANLCWEIILNEKLLFSQNIDLPIFHFSQGGSASWYDVAVAIKEICQEFDLLENYAIIKPISYRDFNKNTLRPNFSVLDNSKIINLLQIPQCDWRGALKDSLIEFHRNHNG